MENLLSLARSRCIHNKSIIIKYLINKLPKLHIHVKFGKLINSIFYIYSFINFCIVGYSCPPPPNTTVSGMAGTKIGENDRNNSIR